MSWLELSRLSLLQSIEEEQWRFSQVPRSGAGYELSQLASRVASAMHAESSNGDPFAKVKSLISEMIAKLEEEASAGATHNAYGDRDAGCCSELPGMWRRRSSAVFEQREKVDSCGLMWTWSRWAKSPRCAAREERFPAGWTVSGRDGYSNDSVAGRERTAIAKTFTTARTSRRM